MLMNDSQAISLAAVIGNLDRARNFGLAERGAIASLPTRVTTHAASHHLVREGERPESCCFLLEGYACRHKTTSSGARQIVSFHIPGDILDIQHLELERADHNVQTISAATIAWIAKPDLLAIIEIYPAIRSAVWRAALVDASIFREWVLNVGRRDALGRVAHLLCEFAARCQAAGHAAPERFELPMSQEQIADATGLTPVHVNRMLQELGIRGVIARDRRDVRIIDWHGLRRLADFDAAYLHLAA